jgi:hypothetical protein
MTNEEKTSLKAACLQAATTLIAARDSTKGAVDVEEGVTLAAELYCRVTAMNWRPGKDVKVDAPVLSPICLSVVLNENSPHGRRALLTNTGFL